MAINANYQVYQDDMDPIESIVIQQSNSIDDMYQAPPRSYEERLAVSKTLDAYSSIVSAKIVEIKRDLANYEKSGETYVRRRDEANYNIASQGYENCLRINEGLRNYKTTKLDPAIKQFHVGPCERFRKSKITLVAGGLILAAGYTYASALLGKAFLPN